MPTDHQLMLSVRDGNIEKLGQLFEDHHKRLYNFFLRQTGNRQASEDLVQDVFLRMLKYRHTYRDEGSFDTWMFSIARNARINYLRKNSVQYELLDETDNLVSSDPNPEEVYDHECDIAVLEKAMAVLPEDKREVILMCRFNNLRYEEIGKILGCTVGTVKVRVYRAMKELTEKYFELTGGKRHEM